MPFTEQIGKLEEIIAQNRTEEIVAARRKFHAEWCAACGCDTTDLIEDFLSDEFYLRTDSRRYLNRGEGQLVIKLDDRWVAKAANHFKFKKYYVMHLSPNYTPKQHDMMTFLYQEFGFDIPAISGCLKNKEGKAQWYPSTHGTFMIMPNLTEGGRYLVRDIRPREDFKAFKNGQEIKQVFLHYMEKLDQLYHKYEDNKQEWSVRIGRHNEKGSHSDAFRKMFFLQVATDHTAKIVPGDFDHACFYRTKR
ncbi:MAG: hypothetical protein V1837_04110 [Candidatus Woesearchaeota archaeon]